MHCVKHTLHRAEGFAGDTHVSQACVVGAGVLCSAVLDLMQRPSSCLSAYFCECLDWWQATPVVLLRVCFTFKHNPLCPISLVCVCVISVVLFGELCLHGMT